MKKIYSVIVILMIGVSVFITCKPDPIEPPPTPNPPTPLPVNRPPVANAGKDTTISVASCTASASIKLDGSASSDPDNSNLTYLWRVVFAPSNNYLSADIRTARPIYSNLKPGEYNFELTVTDPLGLFARDTVAVKVVSSIKSYDLDITINGQFHFQDNYADCYYCYNPCCYYDISSVDYATGSFSPIGLFNFYAYETSDTATNSSSYDTNFGLYTGNGNEISAYGSSSVNLKSIYQSGGGSFTGTFTPVGGSAINCNSTIFQNITPLIVTGTMNATTNTITLNIKGKIYF